MLIQVGELAKRAGLTVRTLHHYEQTGLLTPSARSEAGYRLYNLSAVQRLHMIKALAQAGLTLATIKDYLDRQTLSLPELLTQQIDMLNAQLRDVGRLRDRLLVLRETLASGNEPDLESWLQTLELMKMYDRWFSQQELAALPFAAQDEQRANGGGADADGERLPDGQSAGDASGDALDGAPGAGYGRASGVSDPPERDACRRAANG